MLFEYQLKLSKYSDHESRPYKDQANVKSYHWNRKDMLLVTNMLSFYCQHFASTLKPEFDLEKR